MMSGAALTEVFAIAAAAVRINLVRQTMILGRELELRPIYYTVLYWNILYAPYVNDTQRS